MTLKTLITMLLVAVSFLLFTACDSKVENNDINEQSPTVHVDTTTEDETTEINTTIPADKNTTVNIKSLKLTVEKTSLNKDENTTVKVMAIYSDGTSKEVTNEVNWIQKPKDTLIIRNAVLSSLKDIDTEIRATLPKQRKASNAVMLNLYWEVRNHRLPPEPDSIQNNATLEGIDSNNNGVRDDVERKIYEKYEKALHVALLMDGAKILQKVTTEFVDKESALSIENNLGNASDCYIYGKN